MQKSNWKKCKLGDVVTIKHGFAFKGDFFTESPTPYILVTPGNFNIGGGFKANKLKYYNGPISQEYILQAGDVIVTMTDLSKTGDTLGYSATVPLWKGFSFLHNQRIGLVVFKNSQVDKKFIYWLMRCGEYQHYIVNTATGSTVKHTSPSRICNFEFLLPSLDEQKRIAEFLGAFDDKIELLQKQNKTLEEMAKATFKSWFVDFDVVKAKQRGNSKTNVMREYHLTDQLYDLFPSSFTDSALGPIPLGWEVKKAGDLIKFSIGGGWGNDEETEEFSIQAPVIRGTDIPRLRNNGSLKSIPVRYHKISNHTSRKLQLGDIVLEVAGGSKGQPVGRALFIGNYILEALNNALCASFCKLLRINESLLLPEIFYLYLDNMYETGEIEQYQVQSTGISNFQFKQFCEDKTFIVPSLSLQQALSIEIYVNKIENNKKQIQTLTELRDSLLPRLLSGKIRV